MSNKGEPLPHHNTTITMFFKTLLFLLPSLRLVCSHADSEPHSHNNNEDLGLPSKLWHELGRGIGNEHLSDLAAYSVATSQSGYTVAIGSPLHTSLLEPNADPQTGRVRVYRYNMQRNGWTKIGQDIEGQNANDQFGRSVALSESGSVLAVGAPYCDRLGKKEVGCVKVYELKIVVKTPDNDDAKIEEEEVWFEIGDTIVGEKNLDHFGMAVQIQDGYDLIQDRNGYTVAM